MASRVVSLLPSATEIVYALGLEDQLVGVSFECDQPPSARLDKAVVVSGRDTSVMSPGEIDAHVRAQIAAGAELYTLDADALAGLAPDVILTQDLCGVCALPAGNVERALAHLGAAADVVTLDPHSLEEVLTSILTVGVRLGDPAAARDLVAGLRDRLDAVADRVAGAPRARVAVIEWTDPPFTAGHWVPDLVTAAGGEPVGARPGERSERTTWEAVRASAPDVVLVAPCGYALDPARAQAAAVAGQFPQLPVWAIDADGLVVRPGPRLVDGVEAMAAILHPDLVPAALPGAVARVG